MDYKFLTHKNCMENNCMICDGGLSVCTVCKGAEIGLTTECCGRELTDIEEIKIRNKVLDFVNRKWIEK